MSFPFPRIEKGSRVSIKVIHVTNPHDFYVTPVNTFAMQQYIMNECAAKAVITPPFDEKELSRGKRVIAYDPITQAWKRATILKANLSLTKIQLKYIDFGTTGEVPLDKLRMMEFDLGRFPNLAIHCKLFWCNPREEIWTESNIEAFKKFLGYDRYGMFMVIKEMDSTGMCTVDITNQCNDCISMMMVYSYEACLGDPKNEVNRISNVLRAERRYFIFEAFQPGQRLDVLMSHLEESGNFFVRKVQLMQKYMVLMKSMEDAYAGTHFTDLDELAINHCVACRFKNEFGGWSRALIKDVINGAGSAEPSAILSLVDSGITVYLPMSEMRILKPQFYEDNALAIYCKLDLHLSPQPASRCLRKIRTGCFTIMVSQSGDKFITPHAVIIDGHRK